MEYKEVMTSKEFFTNAREIYDALQDRESKDIFEKRMFLSSTGICNVPVDRKKIIPRRNWSDFQSEYQNLCKAVEMHETEDMIVFYGAGYIATLLISFFGLNAENNKNIVFCDKKNHGKNFHCFPTISTEALLSDVYKDAHILITTYDFQEEVFEFLVQNGFSDKQIHKPLTQALYTFLFKAHDWYVQSPDHLFGTTYVPDEFAHIGINVRDQYFDDLVQYGENEVFVDIGVLTGETSFRFAEICPSYEKIYLFEPDLACYENTIKNMQAKNLKNAEIYPYGIWSEKAKLACDNNQPEVAGGVSFAEDGEILIDVDTLDNFFIHNADDTIVPPTYIKMDIEGVELGALKGGAEVIKKYKPKLAISLYHNQEDIIDLPLYILSLVPEYKLYLRHYSKMYYETVLYAVL